MRPRGPALRTDLRSVSRAPVPRRALGELIALAHAAPEGARLWLAERWPWTSSTEAALSILRPRWAVTALAIADVRLHEQRDPESAVRELNRAHDPWPDASKHLLARR